MNTEQLFFPIKGIDRREESPLLQECKQAKHDWERFIWWHFNLDPIDEAYKYLFPNLDGLNPETLTHRQLGYYIDWFTQARHELQRQIAMANEHYYRFQDESDDSKFQALQHWVEWCDIFETTETQL